MDGKPSGEKKMKAFRFFAGVMIILVAAIVSFSAATESYAEEKAWSEQAEVAFVDTGGNTDVTTLSAKSTLKYLFSERLSGTWKFLSLYGKSDGESSAENYSTEFRVDFLCTKKLYSFVNAGWLKDRFGGIDSRYYLDAGAGYKFLLGPKHFLLGEISPNYTIEEYTDGGDSEYLGVRAFSQYEYVFGGKNKFTQSLEYLADLSDSQNWRLNSETAVISALNSFLSLKSSYVVKYDNQPFEDLDDTDTILGVSLIVNF
jgi:putative salt-induced outer membrane protein